MAFDGKIDQTISTSAAAAYALRSSATYTSIAQSYTSGYSLGLTYAYMRLYRVGNPTGNMWVKIYTFTGADPYAGTLLATSEPVDASSISTVAQAEYKFGFLTPFVQTSGTQYYIVLEADYSINASNYVSWYASNTNVYAGGNALTFDGATWQDRSPYDMSVKTYVAFETYYWRPAGSYGGNGSDSSNGLSWATAKLTLASIEAVRAAGESVKVCKTPNPVSLGTVTATRGSKSLTFPADVIRTVSNCETSWTAANGASTSLVTTVGSTFVKEGTYRVSVTVPASPATNTLYSYSATGTLDLSGYTNISLWVDAGTALAENTYKLCLCSNANGTGVVDEFLIPKNNLAGFNAVVTIPKNGGGALGSSIQSVALYSGSVAPTGSQQIRMDCIIACNGLSLNSLISHAPLYPTWATTTAYSVGDIVCPTMAACRTMLMRCTVAGTSGGSEPDWSLPYLSTTVDGSVTWEVYTEDSSTWWHAIQSLVGTAGNPVTCLIDNAVYTASSAGRGWSPPSGTYTLRYRETSLMEMVAPTQSTVSYTLPKGGTQITHIDFSGGWNPDTDSIDGTTILDGCYGNGVVDFNVEYSTVRNFVFARHYQVIISAFVGGLHMRGLIFVGFYTTALLAEAHRTSSMYDIVVVNPPTYGVSPGIGKTCYCGNIAVVGGLSYGMVHQTGAAVIRRYYTVNCASGINFGSYTEVGPVEDAVIESGTASFGNVAGISMLKNCVIVPSTEFTFPPNSYNTRVYSANHDGVTGNNRIFALGISGTWFSTGGYGNRGYWQFTVTSTLRTKDCPFSLGGFGDNGFSMYAKVREGHNCTVSLWVRRQVNVGAMLKVFKHSTTNFVEFTSVKEERATGQWEKLSITIVPYGTLPGGYMVYPVYLYIWDGIGTVNTCDVSGPFVQSDGSVGESAKKDLIQSDFGIGMFGTLGCDDRGTYPTDAQVIPGTPAYGPEGVEYVGTGTYQGNGYSLKRV